MPGTQVRGHDCLTRLMLHICAYVSLASNELSTQSMRCNVCNNRVHVCLCVWAHAVLRTLRVAEDKALVVSSWPPLIKLVRAALEVR